MLKLHETLTLLNRKSIELYPLPEDIFERESVQVCTDIELFATNVPLLLSNSDMILSDSRLFLAPVDMECRLEYSGKLKPTTLGAYLEWWLNYSSSRDREDNPIIQMVGSPLSGGNKCISVAADGSICNISVPDFSATFHSFLSVSSRYREYMYKFASYSFEKVIEVLNERSNHNEKFNSNLDYFSLNRSLQESSVEYLSSLLAPRIQEAKCLYHHCKRVYDITDGEIREQDKLIEETKQKFRKGEITMNFYQSIREAAENNKAKVLSRRNDWWLFHFIKYYYEHT